MTECQKYNFVHEDHRQNFLGTKEGFFQGEHFQTSNWKNPKRTGNRPSWKILGNLPALAYHQIALERDRKCLAHQKEPFIHQRVKLSNTLPLSRYSLWDLLKKVHGVKLEKAVSSPASPHGPCMTVSLCCSSLLPVMGNCSQVKCCLTVFIRKTHIVLLFSKLDSAPPTAQPIFPSAPYH